MELDTTVESLVKFRQQYLRKHKIDHNYDERVDDWNCPLEQVAVRDFFEYLKGLNCLPDDVPWIQEELKRENENHT